MRRLLVVSAVVSCLFAGVSAQFGKLTKALDKAKSISDIQISEADERALGEAISEKIRAVYGVQQDADATRYVTLVGKVVAAHSSRPNLDYRFIILDSDSTNAFATPGGFIHITRGALALMKDEAELAGVLAHEIAHVTEKHTIESIQKMKGIQLAQEESSITANSKVFQMIVDKSTEAILQGFGRNEELEADRVGVVVVSACRYSAAGLTQFLTSLQSRYEQRENRAGLFASHPESSERLKKIDEAIAKGNLGESQIALGERFKKNIKYQLTAFTGTGSAVGGAKGLAGDSGSSQDKKAGEKEGEKKKSGGAFSKLKNPFGSGEKQERAEVTGSAAARGVDTELGVEEPGNPAVVNVTVAAKDVEAFKAEGGLA